jgi:hypothetical protein
LLDLAPRHAPAPTFAPGLASALNDDHIQRVRKLVVDRPPIPRPPRASPSFACPACDFVLHDGVDYTQCPICALPVDWVDLTKPLWCCATCDALVNEQRSIWPYCSRCNAAMDRVHCLEQPPASNRPEASTLMTIGGLAWSVLSLAQLVVAALDPIGFVFVAPILLLVLLGALAAVVVTALGSSELLAISRARTTRVIHGLEHACIHVLLERGHTSLAGQTTDGMFTVELANDGRATECEVATAALDAIHRVHRGEHALAYSQRCGTSSFVALSLAALAILAGATVGIVAGASHPSIALGCAIAMILAWLAARPLGLLAQRWWTVSTAFNAARVERIVHSVTADGRRARFVVMLDVDQRTSSGISNALSIEGGNTRSM